MRTAISVLAGFGVWIGMAGAIAITAMAIAARFQKSAPHTAPER